MKKLQSAALSALMVLTLSSAATPAHAVIGIFTANPVLVIGGDAVALGSGFFALADKDAFTPCLIVAIVGMVALDENGNPTADLVMPSPAQAQKLGLTRDELSSLQSEFPQVNAINENNTATGQAMLAKGATQAELQSFATSAWNADSALLSPATVSAVNKLLAK